MPISYLNQVITHYTQIPPIDIEYLHFLSLIFQNAMIHNNLFNSCLYSNRPPPKNLVKRGHSLPETDGETPSSDNACSKESLVSSTEHLNTEVASRSGSLDSVSHEGEGEEEPYYDSVAADAGEYVYIQGIL